MSNTFSQYLEYKLQEYCKKNNLYLLREVRFDQSRDKMDYLICAEKELNDYLFNDKKATEIPAEACIEAQWDQGKFEEDFMENDLRKLNKFNRAKLRIGISAVPKGKYKEFKEKLKKKYSKNNYLICIFKYKKSKEGITAIEDPCFIPAKWTR